MHQTIDLELDPAVPGVYSGNPYPFGIDPVSVLFVFSRFSDGVMSFMIEGPIIFYSDLEYCQKQADLPELLQNEDVCGYGDHSDGVRGHACPRKPHVGLVWQTPNLPQVSRNCQL